MDLRDGIFICPHSTEGVSNADLVLLVTTRPTTGNTLAWAVACERDQWGRAIAGRLSCEFVGLNGCLYLACGMLQNSKVLCVCVSACRTC